MRKVAVGGAVLAGVGVVLGSWSQQLTFAAPMTPMDQAVWFAVSMATTLSAVFIPAGAVMIALAVLIAVTGRLPVRDHPALLVWAGLGLILVSITRGPRGRVGRILNGLVADRTCSHRPSSMYDLPNSTD